jgi:adenosine kinase
VGILGKDGQSYLNHLSQAGVTTDYLTIDKTYNSAVGHVMTDLDNNQIWSYYPGPLTRMKDIRLQKIVDKKDLIALLPSQPLAFEAHLEEVILMGNDFLFDPAFFIPNLTKEILLIGIKRAKIVIGNDYEIGLMERKTGVSVSKWLDNQSKIVIKTLGVNGSVVYQGKKVFQIPAAKVNGVVDPTGAGDAYRAGFLAGMFEGQDLHQCGWLGAVAAAYSVEKAGTQTHRFTKSGFEKRYALRPGFRLTA